MEGDIPVEDTAIDVQVSDIHVKHDPAAVDWRNAVRRSWTYGNKPSLRGRPMNDGSGNLTRLCCVVRGCNNGAMVTTVACDHTDGSQKCSAADA